MREVTRQFAYIRGSREFFVVFDRVEATNTAFPKTWFLHIPSEPQVSGADTVRTPGHVYAYHGDTATWLSHPAGEEPLLSHGQARAFLRTILPQDATIVKRGGEGHDFWGHPYEPTAQYNHVGGDSLKPPIVPWRLEVEGPGGVEREYFLHVLEISDPDDAEMSGDGQVGVRLKAIVPIELFFSLNGAMTADVKFGEAPEQRY